MSVEIKQDAIVLREKLAQIVPKEIQPNFGGMPTVGNTPILESGSNANGNWVKYEDGTMIQAGKSSVTHAANNATGNVFYSDSGATTYPLAFMETPVVTVNMTDAGVMWAGRTYGNSATLFRITVMASVSGSSGNIDWIAYGKWK